MELSDIDKKIIVAMQDQLPVVPEPFKAVAEGIGITEELLLSRLQAMKEAGALRKLGAVLRHRQVGMKANVTARKSVKLLQRSWGKKQVYKIVQCCILLKNGRKPA